MDFVTIGFIAHLLRLYLGGLVNHLGVGKIVLAVEQVIVLSRSGGCS